ncbi:MAG: hypothetical protein RBT39_16950 [Azoarcus sp.]|jgi:hypothetical protein|nr:hypothetical protein [Azoarcus sp.]MDX9839251.1 hypothetical protein [Azoarcus sp.]
MSAMKSAEHGSILIAVLLILVIGSAGAALSSGTLSAQVRMRAQASSMRALAQARDALLGYAISYAERHPGQGYGFLPCPDATNTGSARIGACNVRDHGAIGRFPYRTLGLSDLRDGWGECLWYAVAGSVKNNPKPLTLNWDSPGQFDVIDNAGRPLATQGGRPQRAVAVLLAPGQARAVQTRRPASGRPCPGGNDAAAELPAYLDLPYPADFASTHAIVQGNPSDSTNNDLVTWITTDDIFDSLRRRHDFPVAIDAIVSRATDALGIALNRDGFLSAHASQVSPERFQGPVPDAGALGIAPQYADAHDNWRDQLYFVACSGGRPCLHAELTDRTRSPPSANIESCRALVLFGGERIRSGAGAQSRLSLIERADPTQFFEGITASSLVAGSGDFSGSSTFTVSTPSNPATTDVIKCVH